MASHKLNCTVFVYRPNVWLECKMVALPVSYVICSVWEA